MAQQPSAYQLTEEERKAIAYQQQAMRRAQFEKARLARLVGNPLALYNLKLNFRPLTREGTPINREASGLFVRLKP
jgi:hypothetical protein